MDSFSAAITAIATALLVAVGLMQFVILSSQRRQARLAIIQDYRARWLDRKKEWGIVVFVGRAPGDYYQVVPESETTRMGVLVAEASNAKPTIWALDAARVIFGTFSDVCIQILDGTLEVRDVYPIFGSELLRQSRPLRIILENNYNTRDHGSYGYHQSVRTEMQDLLIYHDGMRRRSLILLDLLWAEAARLEDIAPSDLKSAADAKKYTGKKRRKRVYEECKRLKHRIFSPRALKLAFFLRHSEYRQAWCSIGIDRRRLEKLDLEWTKRLLKRA